MNLERFDLYATSKSVALDLKDKSSIGRYNNLWKQLSNGGKLEMKWKRSDPYDFLSDSLYFIIIIIYYYYYLLLSFYYGCFENYLKG